MKTKTQTPLRTLGEWYEIAHQQYGHKPSVGLVGLEQAYYQSIRRKVCVRCLAPDHLVLQTSRMLVASSNHYLCQDCIDASQVAP